MQATEFVLFKRIKTILNALASENDAHVHMCIDRTVELIEHSTSPMKRPHLDAYLTNIDAVDIMLMCGLRDEAWRNAKLAEAIVTLSAMTPSYIMRKRLNIKAPQNINAADIGVLADLPHDIIHIIGCMLCKA